MKHALNPELPIKCHRHYFSEKTSPSDYALLVPTHAAREASGSSLAAAVESPSLDAAQRAHIHLLHWRSVMGCIGLIGHDTNHVDDVHAPRHRKKSVQETLLSILTCRGYNGP